MKLVELPDSWPMREEPFDPEPMREFGRVMRERREDAVFDMVFSDSRNAVIERGEVTV